MKSKTKLSLFWFRRDLRLVDNHALAQALKSTTKVLPIFIFDPQLLQKLPVQDPRVEFIHQSLQTLRDQLQQAGGSLALFHGAPQKIFRQLLRTYDVEGIYLNHDYEPEAIHRDAQIKALAQSQGCPFKSYKDQCLFEKNDVRKKDGAPYTVFTPYKNQWLKQLQQRPIPQHRVQLKNGLVRLRNTPWLSLQQLGFQPSGRPFPTQKVRPEILQNYHQRRDFPALEGTSRLSVHLRFGTVSPRRLIRSAQTTNTVWLNELIWREFFMQILFHFPHVTTHAFKKNYERIPWRRSKRDFEKWCRGQTGYPLVDAGMRELNHTGYMHNRVRMVTASFLCKHLLIDWRWGERYFAQKLLDFELASNNGNWQWAAGSGCDAAPYFRIFNPHTQLEKFDPQREYVKKWLPDLDTAKYPKLLVDHSEARERALTVYKTALSKN